MTEETGPAVATLIDGELVPGQPSTRSVVPWWSFTKTVIAAAALRLVERGRLTLDDPIPEQRYTLRQLLQHTSGLRNYSNLKAYEPAVRRGDTPWPPEEMLERLAAGLPPFEPRSAWVYSNAGYYIVRRQIERTVDRPLDEALNLLVFSPLGVTGTVIAATAQDLQACAWGVLPRHALGPAEAGNASAALRQRVRWP